MPDTPTKLLDIDFPFRFILSTETDADSPDNEVTYGQMRLNFEGFYRWAGGKLLDGILTADPSGSADGLLVDTTQTMVPDAHIGRLVVVTTGDAIANALYVVDNTATTLTLSTYLNWQPGDPLADLLSLGLRAGDQYSVTYHVLKESHHHDGINSSLLGPDAIGQSQLKTSEGSGGGTSLLVLTGGEYTFWPGIAVKNEETFFGAVGLTRYLSGGPHLFTRQISTWAAVTVAVLTSTGTDNVSRVEPAHTSSTPPNIEPDYRWLYVTASGKLNWVFALYKLSNPEELCGIWVCQDHPCFGNGPPSAVPHPFGDIDTSVYGVYTAFLSEAEWKYLQLRRYPTSDGGYLTEDKLAQAVNLNVGNPYTLIKDETRGIKSLCCALLEEFSLDFAAEDGWPEEPESIALPSFSLSGELITDWRTKPEGTIVYPVKSIIEKPDYIKTVKLRKKTPGAVPEPLTAEDVETDPAGEGFPA